MFLLDFFNTATFKTTPVNIIIHTKVEETIEIIAAFCFRFCFKLGVKLSPYDLDNNRIDSYH